MHVAVYDDDLFLCRAVISCPVRGGELSLSVVVQVMDGRVELVPISSSWIRP